MVTVPPAEKSPAGDHKGWWLPGSVPYVREQTGDGRQEFVSTHEGPDVGDTPLIDLGATREQPAQSEPGRQRHGWLALRSRHIPLPLVLALLLGTAAVTGAGTYRWQARQQRLAAESVVSLLVLGQAEMTSGSGHGSMARIESSVMVVNSGPLPVEITDIRAAQTGRLLRSVKPDVVRPGVGWFTVWLTVDCSTAVPNESVPVTASVRTADGKSRDVTFHLPPRPWQFAFESMCLPPPGFGDAPVPVR
ncbi:hypothetical protein GA0074695_6286 [Micromonospora viridifaciens]|uniref:Uncharacterized protein n=1 Tax=Micromonospora viridifaciens TaxID=1881 RepID=A0A1C4ZXE7_MICVI|nr:hypothetical protein [Micromonospora viridifaciens]SCF37633.1 hypothetical protein GA0074695_6286 [Micromonospora viridifaciens]